MQSLKGLTTAMVTPLTADGTVNYDAAAELARHIIDSGSDAIVVGGTTGESASLTPSEHRELLLATIEELAGATVIANGGSNDTRKSLELTKQAVECGASAILVVTPYYNTPNRRGILAHFRKVAAAAEGTPVIVYNNPARTVVNLDIDLIRELSEIENIVALKESNNDQLQPIEGLTVLSGNDDFLAHALNVGCDGGICVASNFVSADMKRLFTEPENRTFINAKLEPIYDAMGITSNPIPVKEAMRLLGHDVGGLRLPLVPADEQESAFIARALENYGLIPQTVSV